MCTQVSYECATVSCFVPTPRDLTGKGALTRVGAQMRLESVLPSSYVAASGNPTMHTHPVIFIENVDAMGRAAHHQ